MSDVTWSAAPPVFVSVTGAKMTVGEPWTVPKLTLAGEKLATAGAAGAAS